VERVLSTITRPIPPFSSGSPLVVIGAQMTGAATTPAMAPRPAKASIAAREEAHATHKNRLPPAGGSPVRLQGTWNRPVEVADFEDGQRIRVESGRAKWWYFDAHLDEGAVVVVVFYTNPNTATIEEISVDIELTRQVRAWRPKSGRLYFRVEGHEKLFAWLPSVPKDWQAFATGSTMRTTAPPAADIMITMGDVPCRRLCTTGTGRAPASALIRSSLSPSPPPSVRL
jgi:hypothetical protein